MEDESLLAMFNEQKRSYYNIGINPAELFNDESAQQKCREFIEAHFTKGHKGCVLIIPEKFRARYDSEGKHVHSVSLYLLGLSLKKYFDKALKTKLDDLIDDNDWYDYIYSWYLSCIYHDVASCVEREELDSFSVEEIENSKFFLSDQSLRRFSKSTMISYLEYRQKQKLSDHGIIAGIRLYEELVKSFEQNTEKVEWTNQQEYFQNGLCWRKGHIPHFAYVADAVCCHNIWMAYPPDLSKMAEYRSSGLSELVIDTKEKRLDMKAHPLQFILCLLDTIEPVKRFDNLSPQATLENIFIRQEQTSIYISWTDFIKSQRPFYKWLSNINELSDWVNVEVSDCTRINNRCGIRIMLTDLVNNPELLPAVV